MGDLQRVVGIADVAHVLGIEARRQLWFAAEELAETFGDKYWQDDQGTGGAVERAQAAYDTSRAHVLGLLGLTDIQADPHVLTQGDLVTVLDPQFGAKDGQVTSVTSAGIGVEGPPVPGNEVCIFSWTITWDRVANYVTRRTA